MGCKPHYNTLPDFLEYFLINYFTINILGMT